MIPLSVLIIPAEIQPDKSNSMGEKSDSALKGDENQAKLGQTGNCDKILMFEFVPVHKMSI